MQLGHFSTGMMKGKRRDMKQLTVQDHVKHIRASQTFAGVQEVENALLYQTSKLRGKGPFYSQETII